MKNRKLDLNQLKIWATRFKNASEAMAFLSADTGIGFYSLRNVFQGKREPKRSEQAALCKATGLDEDTLFPVFEAKKESA